MSLALSVSKFCTSKFERKIIPKLARYQSTINDNNSAEQLKNELYKCMASPKINIESVPPETYYTVNRNNTKLYVMRNLNNIDNQAITIPIAKTNAREMIESKIRFCNGSPKMFKTSSEENGKSITPKSIGKEFNILMKCFTKTQKKKTEGNVVISQTETAVKKSLPPESKSQIPTIIDNANTEKKELLPPSNNCPRATCNCCCNGSRNNSNNNKKSNKFAFVTRIFGFLTKCSVATACVLLTVEAGVWQSPSYPKTTLEVVQEECFRMYNEAITMLDKFSYK